MATAAETLASVREMLSLRDELDWAFVFGSVARGGPFRDVDVAVMPNAAMPTGAVAFGQLLAAIESAVGARVDLVDLRAAPLPLLGAMLPERVVVLDRLPDRRRSWEADAYSRWLDFKPAWDEANRIRELALRERLARR